MYHRLSLPVLSHFRKNLSSLLIVLTLNNFICSDQRVLWWLSLKDSLELSFNCHTLDHSRLCLIPLTYFTITYIELEEHLHGHMQAGRQGHQDIGVRLTLSLYFLRRLSVHGTVIIYHDFVNCSICGDLPEIIESTLNFPSFGASLNFAFLSSQYRKVYLMPFSIVCYHLPKICQKRIS